MTVSIARATTITLTVTVAVAKAITITITNNNNNNINNTSSNNNNNTCQTAITNYNDLYKAAPSNKLQGPKSTLDHILKSVGAWIGPICLHLQNWRKCSWKFAIAKRHLQTPSTQIGCRGGRERERRIARERLDVSHPRTCLLTSGDVAFAFSTPLMQTVESERWMPLA